MAKKQTGTMVVDILMCVALLLLMTYNLIGDAFHEWVGTAMLVLFLLHHGLNRKWTGSIFRGRYTAHRSLLTVTALLVLLTMLASMVSGIILSRYVFSFLNIETGRALSRGVHLVCAYWSFLLSGLHFGLPLESSDVHGKEALSPAVGHPHMDFEVFGRAFGVVWRCSISKA